MRRYVSLLLMALVVGVLLWQQHASAPLGSRASISSSAAPPASAAPTRAGMLPPEAQTTLAAIAHGGPFTHRQDGVVFGNHERLLPAQPRGYYREYTVETPGAATRGARRIITGGTPPLIYYTDDHYRSFQRFEIAQ